MSALDLTLREQAAAIASGEVDPAELLDETLARIEERNPTVNAIVDTFPDESRKMLDEGPEGPLRGVPVAIKDEWPLPWRASLLGSSRPPLVPPGESGPYRALRDAGAVIVGVANMHEFGASSTGAVSAYGACHNPWDPERCPGGSSSGPGAAVGARIVAGAVGADGIGSIRYPAAYCGITGLKPTFRRSAMDGHHLADRTRTIVSGPLCVDASDCRLLGGVLFGEELAAGDAKGLRIGTVDSPVWSDCDPEVTATCEEALDALLGATGGERSEVGLEGLEHSKLASILVGQTEELHALTPSRVGALGENVSAVFRALLKYRLLIPGATLEKAKAVRTMLRRSLAEAFERVDVLAWPTVAAPAPSLENPVVEVPSGTHTADEINPRQCGIGNLTGIPAISVPVGIHSSGLPMALQLLGPWGRDEILLDAAEALERATDRQHVEALPPIAAGAPAA